VSDQHSAREADQPGREADPSPELLARKTQPSLWQMGTLFHAARRYPRQLNVAKVDRLAGILRNGLIAPGCCKDGSVSSDLNLVVTGTGVAYDSLIFLHRFGPQSYIYTLSEPGRFMVFIDPAIPVLTPETMGDHWVVLCQDEVYVRERIAPQHVTAVAVHRADADAVMSDLLADFQRLAIPLYERDGSVLWSPLCVERWAKDGEGKEVVTGGGV
jgi:hypothetical protein